MAFVLSVPPGVNRQITDTGDLTPARMPEHGHCCHMFRAAACRKRGGLDMGTHIVAAGCKAA